METRKLIFARHGNAVAAKQGQNDQERPLSTIGIDQAKALGVKIGTSDLVFASPAIRCHQTASLARNGGPPVVTIKDLYPAENKYPTFETAFNYLKYQPIIRYLERKDVTQELLVYGSVLWQDVKQETNGLAVGKQVLFVSHAVIQVAIGLCAVMNHGALLPFAAGVTELLHTNSGECEGFSLDVTTDFRITKIDLIQFNK